MSDTMRLGRVPKAPEGLKARVALGRGPVEVEARIAGDGWAVTRRVRRDKATGESVWCLTHEKTGLALPINAPLQVLYWVREALIISGLDWGISETKLRASRAHVLAIIDACGPLGVTPPKGTSKYLETKGDKP